MEKTNSRPRRDKAKRTSMLKVPAHGTLVHIGGDSVTDLHFKGDPQRQIDRRIQTPASAEPGHIAVFEGEHGDRVRDSGYSIETLLSGATVSPGANGITPHIGSNGNWWLGDEDTGVQAAGDAGPAGADGITPHIGANGNWWLGDEDTETKAVGDDGPAGADGITPHIGANKNWWIGDEDTGVKAAGNAGLPTVTTADNGKMLCVVNGAWKAEMPDMWEGGSY